jgi:hypothetical protein
MEGLGQCKHYRCNLGWLGAADGSINPFHAELSFTQHLSFLQRDNLTCFKSESAWAACRVFIALHFAIGLRQREVLTLNRLVLIVSPVASYGQAAQSLAQTIDVDLHYPARCIDTRSSKCR